MTPSSPRLHDIDPLDSRLADVQAAGAPDVPQRRPAGRLAPALTALGTRSLLLVPLGFAVGPGGMNLLADPALSFLDPIVSVALATLGVFLGLTLDLRRAREGALFAAALFETTMTALLVGAGLLVLDAAWLRSGQTPWLAAALLGVCAAASFAPATASPERPALRVARIGDLDSVLVIVAGSLALALSREPAAAGPGLLLPGLLLVGVGIAVAGWLLVGSAASESERHAFVAGTLLLLGGAAARLEQSALLLGLVAGLTWAVAGGPAADRIGRDVRYVQHPLVVLLLIVAGARLAPAADSLAVAVVYVFCRTAAKLAAAPALARTSPYPTGPAPGLYLLAPGVVGIAFAVNVLQAGAGPGEMLLTAVVIGSLATDLLALAARPGAGTG